MTYITKEDDITILPLSVRSMNCLRRAQIMTVGALLAYPQDELINFRNMGKKSVDEILSLTQMIASGSGEFQLVERRNEPVFQLVVEDAAESSASVFVDNISIKELSLSARAINGLSGAGIQTAEQLIKLTKEDLLQTRNLGSKTVAEILEKIEYLKSNHVVQPLSYMPTVDFSAFEESISAEMAEGFDQPQAVWIKEILTVKEQYPEAQGETLLYRLYEIEYVRRVAKNTILQIVESNGDEISQMALSDRLPHHLHNTTILEELLLELELADQLTVGEVMLSRRHLSVVKYVQQLEDDRDREILQARLLGTTLQEVADQYGLTRERVRQIESKALRKRPHLQEDKYAYIYSQYDFTRNDFMLAFDEPLETYHYLEIQCKASNRKHIPIEEILIDTNVSPKLRKKAERAIYKQYVTWDGVRVKKNRPEMIKHAVKVFCKALTKYDDLMGLYHAQLEELGLSEEPSLIMDGRTYENILNKCDYALWNQWRSLRYYNMAEYDFEELLDTLDFSKYENTEISSLKLFRDYPELMSQYDIQDEYELHNLLKKIMPEGNNEVKFRRMPTIEIGKADTDGQVLSLLLQYAPISVVDLGERYEAAYGVKAATAMANMFKNFDEYFYNGVYTINSDNLSQHQFDRMQAVLTEPLYTIADAKRIYLREFPGQNSASINPYTLKTIGFKVYSDYIVSNRYSTASDYFNELLTTSDIVDTSSFGRTVINIVAYNSELYRLRAQNEIIEFSPMQYVNIRRLNAAGITVADLEDYRNAVATHFEKGTFFTIHSLREDGFTHPLDDLGFEEWFYASALVEDREHFSYQRFGKNRVFLRGSKKFTTGDVLAWLLEAYQRLDIYDLLDVLNNRYSIAVSREKLLTMIGDTDLYYDAIMDVVYIDYDTYFEEI